MVARPSTQRVTHHDHPAVTQRIRKQTEMSIAYYRQHPQEIDHRLRELSAEWDIERALATASASFTLLGSVMSVVKGRRWLLLPLVVQGFFLQHQIEGWCPPLPVFRRLGFRTTDEINRERNALQALRGDSAGVGRSDAEVAPALSI